MIPFMCYGGPAIGTTDSASEEIVVFNRLAHLVTGHPWKVLVVWIAAVAVIVPLSPSLASVSSNDQASFLPSSYESIKAQDLADEAFPGSSGATSMFVVTRADGSELTGADKAKVAAFAKTLAAKKIPNVSGVATSAAQRAPNGKAQLVQVAFEGSSQDEAVQDAVKPLRAAASSTLAGSGLNAGLTGDVAIGVDTQESFSSAEMIVGIATVLLIVVLLGLIFRSPIAALMPILSIGLVYLLSQSLLADLAKALGFHIDGSLSAILIVVLFGIGTDYILFLLFRYRERLRAGDAPQEAIQLAVRRVGEAIASSGLVVMAAMVALLLSDLGSFKSMAPGFIVAVVTMLIASLTLIPALVTLIGPRIFWPSKGWKTHKDNRLFKSLGHLIARRPALTTAVSGGILVALAVGVLFLKPSYDLTGSLPANTKAAQAFEELKTAFPAGALNPTHVYVTSDGTLAAGSVARVSTALKKVEGVATVAPATLNASGTTAQIDVIIKPSPATTEALDLVSGDLRDAAHAAATPGENVLVGGQTMVSADRRAATTHDYYWVFSAAAILILLILSFLLRSLVAPIVLLVGVGLGFAATLGTSVIAFQGFQGEAGLVSMIPMMVYLFVVAVGTDYNILLTTRLREELAEGVNPREAAARAVEHAGPTVAAAGVILAGTFGSLMLAGVGMLTQMGFAVASGILLVAIVMSCVLIPSIATLIGARLWWPRHNAEVKEQQAATSRASAALASDA
jgi:RND superfamily putative drug exporter